MKNKKILRSTLNTTLALMALMFMTGVSAQVWAQGGDPFKQAPWVKKTTPKPPTPPKTDVKGGGGEKAVKKGPEVVAAPPLQARIDYYKRIREEAAVNGQPVPKVTSVLLLDEMSVTGIFKTPRGFAAMVEAKGIKLSYTIYPGEKFFDGQLVAVEENRLVFRKVTKWSNGKFVASVENKPLRQYSLQQDLQGTAPNEEQYTSQPQTAEVMPGAEKPAPAAVVVSPLEEMINQPAEDKTEEAKKKAEPKKKAVSKKRRKKN
ncbi:MAG: hypothetical protein R2684_09275 [Pyrinomonadaceae bacterium]